MSNDELQKLNELVNQKLAEMNRDRREDIDAKAFYLDFDPELDGHVAHVIFVADAQSIDDMIDRLDEFCFTANDVLDEVEGVAFTDCIYRTRDEFDADFGDDVWKSRLTEVTDGQPA